MKSYMEFNLPEETSEHYFALNGTKLRNVVAEFLDQMRDWSKHGTHQFNDPQEALDATRQLLLDKLNFDDVDLYHNM